MGDVIDILLGEHESYQGQGGGFRAVNRDGYIKAAGYTQRTKKT